MVWQKAGWFADQLQRVQAVWALVPASLKAPLYGGAAALVGVLAARDPALLWVVALGAGAIVVIVYTYVRSVKAEEAHQSTPTGPAHESLGLTVEIRSWEKLTPTEAQRQMQDLHVEFQPGHAIVAPLEVVNRSAHHRVSIKMAAAELQGYGANSDWSAWISEAAIATDIRRNLGPEEETSGKVLIALGSPDPKWPYTTTLVIEERVSRKTLRVTVPGRFPE